MIVDPKVFRSYDIRALVRELVDARSVYYGKVDSSDVAPLTTEGVRLIGKGLATYFTGMPYIAVGCDSRLSSPAWKQALAEGLTECGMHVLDLGTTPTDLIYYISGYSSLPAVQITASHCTRELNGMKMVRPGAQIIGRGAGMEILAEHVAAAERGKHRQNEGMPGKIVPFEMTAEYARYLLPYFKTTPARPFRILADAGNGVGGIVMAEIARQCPQMEVTPLYFEPDGNFPHHDANPFEPENIAELSARVPAEGYDLGVAWDGDADRCFFVDGYGRPIPGDLITALLTRYFLQRAPGSVIVYDVRASWAVPEWIARMGGRPVRERVGHSYIKQTMRRENAVFGGEVSGHYYFRDHYYADNGFIPLLAVLDLMAASGKALHELIAELGNYYLSGEINSTVTDPEAVLARLEETFFDAGIDHQDGLSIAYPTWHCNVRVSANDPVLRLNLEARSQAQMEARRDEVLAIIRA